ncbi:MAG: hypothetical protein MUE67_11860 [Anaerolineales bacterium]|jgi:hypothetical protein|nr:hypothetical protein [Anaerolineales bacterium]
MDARFPPAGTVISAGEVLWQIVDITLRVFRRRKNSHPAEPDTFDSQPSLFDAEQAVQEINLLNLWGGPGAGKSETLIRLASQLRPDDQLAILGNWNWPATKGQIIEEVRTKLVECETNSCKDKIKIVLIDYLETILPRGGDNPDFVRLEQELMVDLVQRRDILVIVTSLHQIRQWREPLVRMHQISYLLGAPEPEALDRQVKALGFDVRLVRQLTQGSPSALSWLKQNPAADEAYINREARSFFLAPLDGEMQELAWAASVLLRFNQAALHLVWAEAGLVQDDSYLKDMERIRAMAFAGLIAYNATEGVYYFTDTSTRRLLARGYRESHTQEYRRMVNALAAHYRSEANLAHALYKYFVSAIYFTQIAVALNQDQGLSFDVTGWVQDRLKDSEGVNLPALQASWQTGQGDPILRQELQELLAVDFAKINSMLEIKRMAPDEE